MNEALKNKALFQVLTNHHENNDFKIQLIESSFNQFFSILKFACNRDIARVFLTGITPVIMTGFNISDDLALDERFWDLYGFKKSEVEFLLNKVFGDDLSFIIKDIMLWLE